ncbi:MAG TPA: DUF2933 domain-containing protein [Hydrogenophaga sp.]|uniref:DUF2933 domain-containing protein n=1 Tax=Hydrogenophaga sp. TaxID=1904254 RepID=UPI002CAE2087|nr:DUF2933 domain-containing protein [Hydrogenophaga sp.]HMN94064.1 DUF2933 domain-containing protein [Hydrogenophaga sp.]HMP09878.1 DUF2933 domain-containing protein [Hydrogenophaga sp.]
MNASDLHKEPRPPAWRRPAVLAWVAASLIALFYLLREHWGHILGWWPYLLLMLCPLMHLFHGHGRHGGHGSKHDPDGKHGKH